MDFARFIDLLVSKRLWLSRVDLLGDQREGRLTQPEYRRISKKSNNEATAIEKLRVLNYVNCWHQADCESMAMWDLYGAGGCGVAIKATVASIKAAIAGDPVSVYIGRVKYCDWTQHDEDPQNVIGLAVRKADGYRHENEVRLLHWKTEDTDPPPVGAERFAPDVMTAVVGFLPRLDFTSVEPGELALKAILDCRYRERLRSEPPGISIGIKTSALVDRVVVGPRAQRWILELAGTVAKLHELRADVSPSELLAPTRQRE